MPVQSPLNVAEDSSILCGLCKFQPTQETNCNRRVVMVEVKYLPIGWFVCKIMASVIAKIQTLFAHVIYIFIVFYSYYKPVIINRIRGKFHFYLSFLCLKQI